MATFDRADERAVDRIESDDSLRREVYSLVRYGSAERGDFVPGLSDVDYFLVVERDESVASDVERALRECLAPVDHRGVDLAWEYRENLSNPHEGVPYKFLTVYQADFRRHHTVVYGADVVDELPSYEFEDLLPSRLDRTERLLEADGPERPPLRFLAGETARLVSQYDGADSLRKADVSAALAEHGRDEASRVYEAYLDGRTDEFDDGELERFVREQVARLRAELETRQRSDGDRTEG